MKLIIVGAGSFGREVYTWLTHTIQGNTNYSIKGFIDNHLNNKDILSKQKHPIRIINTIDKYMPNPEEKLVISIADTKVRKNIVNLMLSRGAEFYTLIHPSTIIGQNVIIGQGSIVCPNCILANESKIGDFTIINTACNIGHDVKIGSFNSILPMTGIMGNVETNKGCIIGSGVTIIPKVKIGMNAIVGSGSVVIRNVASNTTVFGNPAKKIGQNKKND
ncbi:acetyltransferase [Candidatus Pelagibacter sp.]|nr:acetyltransferase [Candidatus Pelagibacter sp.]